jgi:hypothetical protein
MHNDHTETKQLTQYVLSYKHSYAYSTTSVTVDKY